MMTKMIAGIYDFLPQAKLVCDKNVKQKKAHKGRTAPNPECI